MQVVPAAVSPRRDRIQGRGAHLVPGASLMRVIVTRPQREAQTWLTTMAARGWDVQSLPLIDIGAAPDPTVLRSAWQDLESGVSTYQAVMFVSASAVQGFWDARPPGAETVPDGLLGVTRCWATGPGTRRALLAAGVPSGRIDSPPADAGQFDSEALWAVVGSQVRSGGRVLIVRGTDAPLDAEAVKHTHDQGVGRDWLAQRLAVAGVAVDFVLSYVRAVPSWDASQQALARRSAADGSVWLFSSSQALSNLQCILPGQDWSAARALASHPRIEKAVRQAGFGVVKLVPPVLDEMIASIESLPS